MDEQQGNRCGSDPRNAASLAQSPGPVAVEFLAHFPRQAMDRCIVQISGQRQFFMTTLPFDFLSLAVDVARIFGLDFHLLGNLEISNAWPHSGQTHQPSISDLGPAQ